MGARGYVVRGTDKRGNVVTGDGITTTDAAVRAMRLLEWGHCSDVAIFRVHDDGREERIPSYEEALGEIERLKQREADIVEACERVADGGQYRADIVSAIQRIRRERDEARATLGANPLSALEAAERRLLEAGGWRLNTLAAGFGVERWERGHDVESRTVALTIERRRLAAKGGA